MKYSAPHHSYVPVNLQVPWIDYLPAYTPHHLKAEKHLNLCKSLRYSVTSLWPGRVYLLIHHVKLFSPKPPPIFPAPRPEIFFLSQPRPLTR